MRRLICWECLTVADEQARGWRAYRADGPDDPEPIVLCYCPACAEREHGGPYAAHREVRQLVRALRTAARSSAPVERRTPRRRFRRRPTL